MNDSNVKIQTFQMLVGILSFIFFIQFANAQSTDQSFPTAITSSEISGKIPARDIGDARQTSYYYVFNAAQGDVFINVVTQNLNGDIDVFTHDNLRPLTKITVYADTADSETGRVIYLRQPTKLVLRIEGRTPNDEAATFRIKFAGSFLPAQINSAENPESPTVKTDNQTDVRVNSVGTIIEIKPKPTPKPKETVAETKSERETEIKEQKAKKEAAKVAANEAEKQAKNQAAREKDTVADKEKNADAVESEAKPVVVVTDDLPVKNQPENEAVAEAKKDSTDKAEEKTLEPVTDKNTAEEVAAIVKTEPKKAEKPKPVKPLPPAALENIRLVVLFKDGSKIERPMSEIIKVAVDKGVLTITSKDGAVGRYSILDVEKMTIE